MSAYAVNNETGLSFGAYGSEGGLTSKEKLSDTIAKLEKLRDSAKGSKEATDAAVNDKRLTDLENRISNLKRRRDRLESREDSEGCQTCKNRKYQDESDDPGVSFKTAQTAKGNVGSAVRSHEQEHVTRDRAEAEREGREVVSQNVRIKTGVCPECGKTYVAGGETTTVTRAKQPDTRFSVGMSDAKMEKGKFLNLVA